MICFNNTYCGLKVLVTGHTGFKGSWLSLWLKQLGAEVAGFSLNIPSSPSNFELLKLDRHLKHYIGDVRDISLLAKVIDEFKPDVIFHMAAQSLVRRSYLDPVGTFETNTMGMVNILECIRTRAWVKAAVLITSDKAYSNNEWCWGYRETDVLGGNDPYSSSKSCADLIAQSYFQSFIRNTPTKIAITRAGNVIGGGDWADDRIVPDCIRAWSSGESVDVRNPHATRPWQHVLEPLSGYMLLATRLFESPGKWAGSWNFGPSSRMVKTVEDVADTLTQELGFGAVEIEEANNTAHEAQLLQLNCDKAHQLLGWYPSWDVDQTLKETASWYSQVLKGKTATEVTRCQIMNYFGFEK